MKNKFHESQEAELTKPVQRKGEQLKFLPSAERFKQKTRQPERFELFTTNKKWT